ncbi:glycoside hydrolase family 15 protein [Amnibacterium flavum]|uniref:Glycoside hydrolase family 15 protein n=1 Tax=Amnibacterium flavum TaxID=2173173 RepID=A0A2V1HRP2_9MICO|nr:glycoside hydrolase family 15 protein [Amnibacterium flavum]PVZ95273.1 glycoside hydrolase family 15 protein [Amnibacterium flavum]
MGPTPADGQTEIDDVSESRRDGYVDLRDYAAIGDGRTIALIARDGRIDWLPIPAMHTAPLFSALLDQRRGGYLELRPTGPFTTQRDYVDGTNVLRTRFTTADGVVEVTDALVTGVAGRLPWAELARRIDGISGEVDMMWSVVPGDLFGEKKIERIETAHGPLLRAQAIGIALVGFEHGRIDAPDDGPGSDFDAPEFRGAFTTSAGSRHLLCLVGTDDEPIHLPDPRIVDEGVDRTIESWATWSREFNWDGPWADAVHRSALALKLLIYSPTGAIMAAATAGLPESLDGDKNWDYRFAWVRDLAYTTRALLRFGLREEPHAAVSWLLKALKANDGEMQIFFRLDGSLPDGTRKIKADGWRGIGPVVDGNPAAGQLQLGVFADMLAIMNGYAQGGNILDRATSDVLCSFADEACIRWEEKDAGMWELEEEQHYTSSKMGCWQAIESAIGLADLGAISPTTKQRATWEKNRQLIVDWVDENSWSEERGAYLMYPGGDALDASVLLHAPSGFDRGERMSRTIDRIVEELSDGTLVYRYSGVDQEEATFVACAFWVVSALTCVGRREEAIALMDRLVAQANDVGLYSEMISVDEHDFLGNLPQGLSHLALVNAAADIVDTADEQ